MAKEIVLVAEDGSFIKIGGGINVGTSGKVTHHGTSFEFVGGQTMSTAFPDFSESTTEVKRELRIELVDADGLTPESEPITLNFHAGNSQHKSTVEHGSCVIKNLPAGSFTIFQPSRRK